MINVHIKHLVIPFIVFIVSFMAVIYGYNQITTNPTFDVGYLYSNSNLYDDPTELNFYNQLTQYVVDNEQLENIRLETSSYSNENLNKLQELTNRFDLIVMNNIAMTKNQSNLIKQEEDTNFILINSDSNNFKNDNAKYINFDYITTAKLAADDLSSASKTHKYLFIDIDKEDSEMYTSFVQEVVAKDKDAEVIHYYVEDPYNNIKIRSDLEQYIADGIDSIYVQDTILLEIIVDTVVVKQQEIMEELFVVETEKEKLKEDPEYESTFERKYTQDKINVVTNTFDYRLNGIYADVNEDGILDEQDTTVVLSSYVYNGEAEMVDTINSLINDTFTGSEVILKPTKVKE